MDCKYLRSETNGLRVFGRCLIDNDICVLSRFCNSLGKIVSADIYKKGGCVKENNFESTTLWKRGW